MFVDPLGDELAVAHMGFLNIFAGFDTHQLSHKTIENVFVIFGFVCVGIIKQANLDQFGVGEIIEREKIGAGLLDSRAVGFERVTSYAREQFA